MLIGDLVMASSDQHEPHPPLLRHRQDHRHILKPLLLAQLSSPILMQPSPFLRSGTLKTRLINLNDLSPFLLHLD